MEQVLLPVHCANLPVQQAKQQAIQQRSPLHSPSGENQLNSRSTSRAASSRKRSMAGGESASG